MSIEAHIMRLPVFENFVHILEAYIQKSLLIDKQIAHVIDDVGTYIQKHVLEVYQVQHAIDDDDGQDNTENIMLEIIMNNNNNNL